MNIINLLKNATATGSSAVMNAYDLNFNVADGASVQCTVSGSGAVAATVDFKVSNDNKGWITAATFVLSGSAIDTAMMRINDFNFDNQIFLYYKADITSLSGTNAAVDFTLVT